ncbi:type II toxin-antitoxin system HicA family toxin [Thermococcus sp. ES12]|uniref:type II toxin-antitoxin system HicA family toxin n=1 Tax=Thermococcus sp. ES12 TaxID=1638246 RepID=UPI00143093B9|nr:type II toxin-antitoxin system HicA family toxin [Thermococcus sp. ES12]NJE75964.1 type II toxin-antitoxin system HicA family toxin [Thermococcus sp. ES12]
MKATDIQKALKKKGFQKKEGGRHTKYILYVDGKKTRIMTVFSRGKDKKELGDDLIKRIKKQLHFDDPKKFEDFVKCPLTYEDYLTILQQKGII